MSAIVPDQRLRTVSELRHDGATIHPLHDLPNDSAGNEIRLAGVAAAFRGFLEALGLDLSDPDLEGTDHRVARAYREMLAGLRRGARPKLSTFPNTEGYTGIVRVTAIPFYSICAHHFLPFFGSAHVGYMPGEQLVGLSKLPRVIDYYARRPQLQERLTEQVAALLYEQLDPAGLIVSIEARHLCMEMRGVSKPGVVTTTTAVRGSLEDEGMQRQFFARLPGNGSTPTTHEA